LNDLTRQELCVRLHISESTVRRMEVDGLPCTPVGRSKRYDLAEVKQWLRTHQGQKCQSGQTSKAVDTSGSWSKAAAFIASSQKVQRRVMPSNLSLISGNN
jgi:phage terminase Nu1 subunit (DNA packaging protein)